MKLGIMQPYFMPYIGYWQLMNAVDKYVVYDDVNFIKGGWINRNRILLNGKPQYFNVQMIGASSFKKINEIEVNINENVINKNLRTLEAAYKKAPYFEKVFPILEEVLRCPEQNLAKYIMTSFQIVNDYLGIQTELIMSSDIKKNDELRGQDKVLHICELMHADEYYNAIRGQALYSYDAFLGKKIKLSFLKTDDIVYQQYNNDFVPNLSIMDMLMFNSVENVKDNLDRYTLIRQQIH